MVKKIISAALTAAVALSCTAFAAPKDDVKKIFEKALCPDNCRFVTGKEGHRFYADPAWKVFKELSGWN